MLKWDKVKMRIQFGEYELEIRNDIGDRCVAFYNEKIK